MDNYIVTVIKRIKAGEIVAMGDGLKNEVNAILAKEFQIGDAVEVIKTKQQGVITKKIKYERNGQVISPNGYTAIQVNIDGRKYNYAARSLRKITNKM